MWYCFYCRSYRIFPRLISTFGRFCLNLRNSFHSKNFSSLMIHAEASNSFCFRYIFDGEPRDRGDIKQSLIREFVTWFGSNGTGTRTGDHPNIWSFPHTQLSCQTSREKFLDQVLSPRFVSDAETSKIEIIIFTSGSSLTFSNVKTKKVFPKVITTG